MAKIIHYKVIKFRNIIREFQSLGFEVLEVAPNKYRFNDCLDIMPITDSYFDLKKKYGGSIGKMKYGDFIRQFFGLRVMKEVENDYKNDQMFSEKADRDAEQIKNEG
jgi:hypothetical protein